MNAADLASAATLALGTVLAWTVFAAEHSRRRRERGEQLRALLGRLRDELQQIGSWASKPYPKGSDEPDWWTPGRTVTAFSDTAVREVALVLESGAVSRAFRLALSGLIRGIDAFRARVRNHADLMAQAPPEVLGDLSGRVRGVTREVGPGSLDQVPATLARRKVPRRDWIERLHTSVMALHVEGIGDSATPAGLHVAWAIASAETDREISIRQDHRVSPADVLGHTLAVIVGVIGLGFLAALVAHVLGCTA